MRRGGRAVVSLCSGSSVTQCGNHYGQARLSRYAAEKARFSYRSPFPLRFHATVTVGRAWRDKHESIPLNTSEIQDKISDWETKVNRFYAVKPLDLQLVISDLRRIRGSTDQRDLKRRALGLVRHVSGVQSEVHALMKTLCSAPESIDSAFQLFDNMKKYRIMITGDTYDILLTAVGRWNYLKKAREILYEFDRFGAAQPEPVNLSGKTLNHLIHRFAFGGDIQTALRLWEKMKQLRLPPMLVSAVSIMRLHLSRGDIKGVGEAFDYLLECGVDPDGDVYSVLVQAYAQQDDVDRSLQIMSAASEQGIHVSSAALESLIGKCAELGRFGVAESILKKKAMKDEENEDREDFKEREDDNEYEEEASEGEAETKGKKVGLYGQLHTSTVGLLIQQYLSYEETEKAYSVFKNAAGSGVIHETILSQLVTELSMKGLMEEAKTVFEFIRKTLRPTKSLFETFLYACAQQGQSLVGLDLLLKGKDLPTVDAVIYEALLISLSNQSKMDHAEGVMRTMEDKRMVISGDAHSAVIKGYFRKGMTEKAMKHLRKVVEDGVTLDEGLFGFLIGVLSKMKDAKGVFAVDDMMCRSGVKHSTDSFQSLLLLSLEKQDTERTIQVLTRMENEGVGLESFTNAGLALLKFFINTESTPGLRVLLRMVDVMNLQGGEKYLGQMLALAKKVGDWELVPQVLNSTTGPAILRAAGLDKGVLLSLLNSFLDTRDAQKAFSVAAAIIRSGSSRLDEGLADRVLELLAEAGESGLAAQLLQLLMYIGTPLSPSTIRAMLHACEVKGDENALAKVKNFAEERKMELDEDVSAYIERLASSMAVSENALQSLLNECNSAVDRESALSRLQALEAGHKAKDAGDMYYPYISQLLDICIRQEDTKVASSVIEMLDRTKQEVKEEQVPGLLQLFVNARDTQMVDRLLDMMEAKNIKPKWKVVESLVSLLLQERQPTRRVLEMLKERGQPDDAKVDMSKAWSLLLEDSISRKDLRGAMDVLRLMDDDDAVPPRNMQNTVIEWCQVQRAIPNRALFHFKLRDCIKGGNMAEMKEILSMLKKARLAPTQKTLYLVLQVCHRANSRMTKEEIRKVVQRLEDQGLVLDREAVKEVVERVWGSSWFN